MFNSNIFKIGNEKQRTLKIEIIKIARAPIDDLCKPTDDIINRVLKQA